MSEDINERKNWLRRIQEGSWEPEILISGIVIYGLFQIIPLLDELHFCLDNYSYRVFSGGNVDSMLIALLKFSTWLLIAGFISHLLFRSVWIAFIGLSYVYKDGVDMNRLKYPELYKKTLRKSSDYKKQIMKLEKICSSIFALSFLFFMWILGIGLFLGLFAVGLAIWISFYPDRTDFDILSTISTTLLLTFLIDLVTLGGLKRIPYLRKIYYPFYRVFSWISLSFLYRNIYYGFVSNHKKWKVGLILLLFVSFAFIAISMIRTNDYTPGNAIELYPDDSSEYYLDYSHYWSMAGGDYSKYISIPNLKVRGEILEVFVVHTPAYEDEQIRPGCDYEAKSEREDLNSDSLIMSCLTGFYQLQLNDSTLSPEYFYFSNKETHQDGLLTYIDISGLETGMHAINLKYNLYKNSEGKKELRSIATLKFYKLPEDEVSDNRGLTGERK
jgi:hypothetical protein